MGDVGEAFKMLKEHRKKQRAENLENASSDGWKKHTHYHWARELNGKKLDYWPTKKKFQYDGRVMCGDVEKFIAKRESKSD